MLFAGRFLNKVTKVTGGGVSEGRSFLNKVTKVTGDGGAKLNKVTRDSGGRDGGGEVVGNGPGSGRAEVAALTG
jgi:hypothetical protein